MVSLVASMMRKSNIYEQAFTAVLVDVRPRLPREFQEEIEQIRIKVGKELEVLIDEMSDTMASRS